MRICTSGCASFSELLADGLDRTADVGPQDDVQGLQVVHLAQPLEEVLQRHVLATAAELALPRGLQALIGQVAGLGNIGQDVEAVAGPGGHVQAGDVHGRRGAGFVVLLVRIERVVHRLDAAVGPAADDDVAGPERAVLHDQLGDHAAVFVHLGLQAGAAGRAVGVGLVLVQFGHGEQGHDQVVHARALGGAGLDDFRFAAPFAGQQLVFRKLAVQAIDD